MNAKTLAALHKSIAKWERIYRYGAQDHGPVDCALCWLFWKHDCAGCPVSMATGKIGCENSPYLVYHRTFINCNRNTHAPSVRSAAKAEYEFLKSLLPKGKA